VRVLQNNTLCHTKAKQRFTEYLNPILIISQTLATRKFVYNGD